MANGVTRSDDKQRTQIAGRSLISLVPYGRGVHARCADRGMGRFGDRHWDRPRTCGRQRRRGGCEYRFSRLAQGRDKRLRRWCVPAVSDCTLHLLQTLVSTRSCTSS